MIVKWYIVSFNTIPLIQNDLLFFFFWIKSSPFYRVEVITSMSLIHSVKMERRPLLIYLMAMSIKLSFSVHIIYKVRKIKRIPSFLLLLLYFHIILYQIKLWLLILKVYFTLIYLYPAFILIKKYLCVLYFITLVHVTCLYGQIQLLFAQRSLLRFILLMVLGKLFFFMNITKNFVSE